MIETIRRHWLLALLLVLALLWYIWPARRKRAATESYAAGQAAAARASGAAAAAASATAGGMGAILSRVAATGEIPNFDPDPTHTKPAPQDLYPGWYRTGDGSWVNVETGETYAAGTSPPAVLAPSGETFTVDLGAQPTGATGTAPAEETQAGGFDFVW